MSSGTDADTLHRRINEALVKEQQTLHLAQGGPNLYPGTATNVAIAEVEKWWEEKVVPLHALAVDLYEMLRDSTPGPLADDAPVRLLLQRAKEFLRG